MLLKENDVMRMEKAEASFALFNLLSQWLFMTPSFCLLPLKTSRERIKTRSQTLWTLLSPSRQLLVA